MAEKEHSICLKKEKLQLITNQKLFKKPTNWNFLELDDDVVEDQFVMGLFIGFW